MEEPTLFDKIKMVLNSSRFWIITLAALMAIIQIYAKDSEVFNIIKIWLATVAGVGTLDSIATKIG